MSRFTHFFRNFFATEKQPPQTFSLLECMEGDERGKGKGGYRMRRGSGTSSWREGWWERRRSVSAIFGPH